MEPSVRKYSIDELNQLLDSIKSVSGLTEGDVMGRIKRNPGYVSQLRSRGNSVPEKLIQALKSEFKEELNKNNIKLTPFEDREIDEPNLINRK